MQASALEDKTRQFLKTRRRQIIVCSQPRCMLFVAVLYPRRLDLTQPEPEATLFRRIELEGLNPDDFETRQRFVSSRDGARIPMFIVQRKGTPRDGNNPTLLYGYGGPSARPAERITFVCEHDQCIFPSVPAWTPSCFDHVTGFKTVSRGAL